MINSVRYVVKTIPGNLPTSPENIKQANDILALRAAKVGLTSNAHVDEILKREALKTKRVPFLYSWEKISKIIEMRNS